MHYSRMVHDSVSCLGYGIIMRYATAVCSSMCCGVLLSNNTVLQWSFCVQQNTGPKNSMAPSCEGDALSMSYANLHRVQFCWDPSICSTLLCKFKFTACLAYERQICNRP